MLFYCFSCGRIDNCGIVAQSRGELTRVIEDGISGGHREMALVLEFLTSKDAMQLQVVKVCAILTRRGSVGWANWREVCRVQMELMKEGG